MWDSTTIPMKRPAKNNKANCERVDMALILTRNVFEFKILRTHTAKYVDWRLLCSNSWGYFLILCGHGFKDPFSRGLVDVVTI